MIPTPPLAGVVAAILLVVWTGTFFAILALPPFGTSGTPATPPALTVEEIFRVY